MKKINIALLGAGRMGKIHSTTVTQHKSASLRYVVDPNRGAAQKIAEDSGARIADEETVFSDDGIDAVIIASAASAHSAQIEAAAKTGKAVFCEKPLGLSLTNVAKTVSIVEGAGIALMLGFNRRFDRHFAAMAHRIYEGEIGRPELLVLTSRDPSPPPIDYIKSCGGIIRETTIHDIDMARWLTGETPETVYASGAGLTDPEISAAGLLDTVVTTLTMPSGARVVINNSWRAVYGYDQRAEVLGPKGMLSVDNLPQTLVSSAVATGMTSAAPMPFFMERYEDAYAKEIDCFIETLLSGGSMSPTARDGLVALMIAEAAIKSVETQVPVHLVEIEASLRGAG